MGGFFMRGVGKAVAIALIAGSTLCAQERMGIPSEGEIRGQRDAVGFASTPQAMARLWQLGELPPAPEKLGDLPAPGVYGVICPHDDYIYAGRMYRLLVPLLTARRVVILAPLHRWQRLAITNRLVFDPFRAWRAPDGQISISPLREFFLSRLRQQDVLISRQASESEHAAEAVAYWLKHHNHEVEIVPILVPGMGFPRLVDLAKKLGLALKQAMTEHGWEAGRDVALLISADAVHYGPDFHHTPFGEGGVEAYSKAVERDKSLLLSYLAGPVREEKVYEAFRTWVNPEEVGTYRLTWCGRFSIPFGYLVAQYAFGNVKAVPVFYATSVGWPELPGEGLGVGRTAPANLYHFVGYPGVVLLPAPAEKPVRLIGPPERKPTNPLRP